MMRKIIIICILFVFIPLTGTINEAKKTALEYVKSLYIERNGPKALQFFYKYAEGKSLNSMKKMLLHNKLPQLYLQNISFFKKKDIPLLEKSILTQFPMARKFVVKALMKRVSQNIKNNLGCAVIFFTKQEQTRPLINIYIFKKIGNTYKIVYQDDN